MVASLEVETTSKPPPPAAAVRTLEPTFAGWMRRVRDAFVRLLLLVAALVLLRVVWHFAMRDDPHALLDARTESDLVARRDYLAAHVEQATHAMAPSDSQFAGEWALVTLSMTSMAAANIGFEHSDTVPTDLDLVARCAELAQRKEARAFDAGRWGDDPIDAMDGASSHLGYLGHLGVILEAYRLLGGTDPKLVALEGKVVAALTTKLAAAKSGLLPTYPGETYVADNAVVLAVLALADVGRGAKASGNASSGSGAHARLVGATLAQWRGKLVDPATGVLVFGLERNEPRASGAAWSAMYLGYADDAFVREQAKALVAHFEKKAFGIFAGLCDRPSCSGGGDVDSGPLVLGLSPAATGFAIALARRTEDADHLGAWLATAEWAGLTVSWGGERHYAFSPLVGDAIVLAAKTARAWDSRYSAR